jgi:6-phosphogluconolactonase (cycloisomerase 2 family)
MLGPRTTRAGRVRLAAGFVALALGALAAPGSADASAPGAVFTSTNSPAGNAVVAFTRAANGSLTPAGSFATGGTGTGGGLGNQGAVVLSDDHQLLFVVNAGSNQISSFEVTPHALRRAEVIGSAGVEPISLTVHGRLLYVLNGGGEGNISGFSIGRDGQLSPLSGSTRTLSATGADAAEVAFNSDGSELVVTEKATGKIDTYSIGADGRPSGPVASDSAGPTPFGFAFDKRDHLIVSEAFGGAAGQSALSSYNVASDGSLETISPSVHTGQSAACWVATTGNGRFAYTTNTGSGNISAYSIGHGGSLTLLGGGVTALTGAAPTDLALSENNLFVLNSGAHTVGAYRVQHNGSLSPIDVAGNLPAGATGLAAS